jgi:hypothetical protein
VPGPQIRTLIPSGNYSASQASSEVASGVGATSLFLVLTEIARPAAETLTISVQVRDTFGTWSDYITFGPTGAAGVYVKLLTPVLPAAVAAAVEAKGGPLPLRWRVNIVHSGAGVHQYVLVAEEAF